MTKLLIALCCAASAIGQTSASLSVTGVPAASIMVSAEATSSINIAALADTATNGALATTATATATTTATTIAVASVTSVTTGMGVLIDGEASLITTISGLNLTVTRTTLGSTASAISQAVGVAPTRPKRA